MVLPQYALRRSVQTAEGRRQNAYDLLPTAYRTLPSSLTHKAPVQRTEGFAPWYHLCSPPPSRDGALPGANTPSPANGSTRPVLLGTSCQLSVVSCQNDDVLLATGNWQLATRAVLPAARGSSSVRRRAAGFAPVARSLGRPSGPSLSPSMPLAGQIMEISRACQSPRLPAIAAGCCTWRR
jgi:hypothetical protein